MKLFINRLIVLFLIIVMLAAFVILSIGYELPHYSGSELYTEPVWTLISDGQPTRLDTQLPLKWQADSSSEITLSTVLTYEPNYQDFPCAFVSFSHMYSRIFLDGKEVYSYTSGSAPRSTKTPGNVYAIVPLGTGCTGKELRIEFIPALHSGLAHTLKDISFGNLPTMLRHTFFSDLPLLALTVITFFCGCLLIVASLFMPVIKFNRKLWYMGIFGILFSVYNTSESLFMIYMVSNPYFLHLINFGVFALLPIPLLGFYYNQINHKLSRIYHALHIVLLGNVVIQTILHFSGIYDLQQMLPATHLMYACTLILISISLLTIEDRGRRRFLTIETTALAAGAILDALNFYCGFRVFFSSTAFLQTGVLIVLLMEGTDMLRILKSTYEENIKSKFYKELAYTDALTQLPNRAAFNKEIAALTSGIRRFQNMICMSVDVNGLKSVNDTLGHQAGDTLIKATADFLQRYFSPFGGIYRTGGDEFFLFLYDIEEQALTDVLRKMYDDLSHYNKTASIPVSFALGYSKYDGQDLEDCMRTADSNMYKLKSEMCSASRMAAVEC